MKKILIAVIFSLICCDIFSLSGNDEARVRVANKCVEDILETSTEVLEEVDNFYEFVESLEMNYVYLAEIEGFKKNWEALIKMGNAYFTKEMEVSEMVKESQAIVTMASWLIESFSVLVEKVEADYNEFY